MFQKGEYVVYGSNGVCMVEEITTLNIDSVPKDREYYVLFPKNSSGKIYVPVDKGDAKMRRVITRAEAEELIARIQNIEPLQVTNEKMSEEMYKKCMRCYDCAEWIRLIKCIYFRKERRLSDRKKITAVDERYMHSAEELLYSELGIALGIPKEQVLSYIVEAVERNGILNR